MWRCGGGFVCLEDLCSFSLPLLWLLLGVTKAAVFLLFFTEEFAFFFPRAESFGHSSFIRYPFISPSKLNVLFSVLTICFSFCWRWWWNSCALPKSVGKEGADTPGARTSLLWCYTIPQNPSRWRQAQAATCLSPAVSEAPSVRADGAWAEPTWHHQHGKTNQAIANSCPQRLCRGKYCSYTSLCFPPRFTFAKRNPVL